VRRLQHNWAALTHVLCGGRHWQETIMRLHVCCMTPFGSHQHVALPTCGPTPPTRSCRDHMPAISSPVVQQKQKH
jgi:hypothetical protein